MKIDLNQSRTLRGSLSRGFSILSRVEPMSDDELVSMVTKKSPQNAKIVEMVKTVRGLERVL